MSVYGSSWSGIVLRLAACHSVVLLAADLCVPQSLWATYSYDENNRLKQVKNAGNTVLANYTYDALGRRITFNDPVAGVTTRYYYDGQSVIEERNASDILTRYHVNGNQFIDERVATFTQTTSQFNYYLGSLNFSVTGSGNPDGSVIQRLDYSSTGDFAGGGAGASAFYHDADSDLDIDLHDFASLQNCFGQTTSPCLTAHDFDTGDAQDGDVDLDDFARWSECSHGPFVTPDQACGIPQRAGAPPPSGTFGMHGRAFDVLSDGFVLQDFRSRVYVPTLGRWSQRDPFRYIDGRNLYEAFASNSLSRLDPYGQDSVQRKGDFLEYTTDGFAWDFARVIGNGLVLIDHPEWPFAFIMGEQDALRAFNTGPSKPDFYNVFSIMSHATGLVTQAGSKRLVVALFDKRASLLGWITPDELENEGLDEFRRLAVAGLQAELAGVGNLTATAFTVTTGALAAPAGVGAVAVDVAATAADVASDEVSLRRGAFVLTAVAAGAALHLRFADDAVLGAGGGAAQRVRRGGIEPVRIGRIGEEIAGITLPKVRIPSVTGRQFRIPDEVTENAVREVKNVKRIGLTKQIQDELAFARLRNRLFILEIRRDTVVSPRLQDLVDRGEIVLLRTLP